MLNVPTAAGDSVQAFFLATVHVEIATEEL